MAEVKIKGLKELHKALSEMPIKIQNNVMAGALREGAAVFRDAARENINSVSGALARSLRTTVRRDRGTKKIIAKISPKKHGHIARFVEFGTKPHLILPKKGSLKIGNRFAERIMHPGARPKPFMRPAFDSNTGKATIAVGGYIKRRLATKHGINTADISLEIDQ